MENVKIVFNEEVIKILNDCDIDNDYIGTCLLILFCLYEERYDLLDNLDDSSKKRRVILLYRYMYRRGLLNESKNERYLYELSPKGESIVTLVKEFETTITAEVLARRDVSWVEKYRNLFPKELQDNILVLEDRMSKFLSVHKYSPETILKATEDYIHKQANSETGHKFTNRSMFFIYRHSPKTESKLASFCENLTNDSDTEENYNIEVI